LEGRLAGDRQRVEDGRADARLREPLGEEVALARADGELVVDVAGGRALDGESEGGLGEELPIAPGDPPPRLRPRRQPAELDAEEGPLELVEAATEAEPDAAGA